jgi:hypothetical protein
MIVVRDFASAYGTDGERVVALTPRSRWRQAEASWVAWANARLATMTDEEKLALVESVFVRARGADGVDRAAPFAFPGFDRFAFGLSIADAWARAGHPKGSGPPSSQLELFSAVVCPKSIAADGAVSSAGRCDYAWYRDALDDGATTRRLTDALLARKDLDLVAAVFTGVDFMSAGGDKLELLFSLARSLDADDALWRRAFHVIADDRAEGGEVARWMDEARRQWAARPPRHGVLLYALAQVDRDADGDNVPWERFASKFGAPLDARDFAAYLDEGVRAVSRAVAGLVARGRPRAAARRVPLRSRDAPLRSPGPRARAGDHRRTPLRRGRAGGHGPDPRFSRAPDRDAPGRGLRPHLRRVEEVREAIGGAPGDRSRTRKVSAPRRRLRRCQSRCC